MQDVTLQRETEENIVEAEDEKSEVTLVANENADNAHNKMAEKLSSHDNVLNMSNNEYLTM